MTSKLDKYGPKLSSIIIFQINFTVHNSLKMNDSSLLLGTTFEYCAMSDKHKVLAQPQEPSAQSNPRCNPH